MVLTDGEKTYSTPIVKVSNVTSGKAGLWLFQVGDRQEFGNFELSHAQFAPPKHKAEERVQHVIWSSEYQGASPALASGLGPGVGAGKTMRPFSEMRAMERR